MPFILKPTNLRETPPKDLTGYITLAEMARLLGITRSGAYKYIRRKQIPATRMGNTLLIRRRDIPQQPSRI